MTRIITTIAIAFVFALGISAQKPIITFTEKEFDFGVINEDDGTATHIFEFSNSGSVPLVIQNVSASCGCTTPDWTKQPIEPGKNGTITATYNTKGRIGPFNKTVTVSSNVGENVVLTIKGEVKGTPTLQFQAGAIKYDTKNVLMGNINKGANQTRSVQIKNTSNMPVKVEIANLPIYYTAIVTPITLKPNESGKIDFILNSKKCNDWGALNNDVYLLLNGKKSNTSEYKLILTSNIVEDFSKISAEQKRKSPIIELKSRNIFLGQISKGNVIHGKVTLKNSGINPLEIRKVINNNPELKVFPVANIKGGKTGELKIEVNTKTIPVGNASKVISLQTNDPQNQIVPFVITYQVK